MRFRAARRRVRVLGRSQRLGAAGAGGGRRRRLMAPPNLRWILDDELTSVQGEAAHGADRTDERALFTRFFLEF
jgi:hypothetical protein